MALSISDLIKVAMEEKTSRFVPQIERGAKIILPEGMSYEAAIRAIEEMREHEETIMTFSATLDVSVADGLLALTAAVRERFGWLQEKPTKSFFGASPPAMITVDTGVGQTASCLWGKFTVAQTEDGTWSTGINTNSLGLPCLGLSADLKQKYQPLFDEVVALTTKIAREHSVFRGKALRSNWDEGNVVRPMTYLDVSRAAPERLIFGDLVQAQIDANLYTPITRRHTLAEHSIPFRRGVLLAGTFGTGKTELAMTCANLATQHGITFIYCPSPADLGQAILVMQGYEPAVIFVEDIDRVASGARDADMDVLLNRLDGLDTKGHDIMVVLTTNKMEAINEAMIRPGRIDAVIELTPPDEPTAERLIRRYGNGLVLDSTDLSSPVQVCAGMIPAVIREVVERAKLSAIARGSDHDLEVSAEDLLVSAQSMKTQIRLLSNRTESTPTPIERAAAIVAASLRSES